MSYQTKSKKFEPNKSNKFEPKNKRKQFDSNYNKAITKASNAFIKECFPPIEYHEDIITNIQYLVNWNGYSHILNVEDDNITIEENNKKYSFSKKHFLKNKKFFGSLYYNYNQKFGNVHLKVKELDNTRILIKMTNKL